MGNYLTVCVESMGRTHCASSVFHESLSHDSQGFFEEREAARERSCLREDLAEMKSSSVSSGFSFRWWEDIHEMSARLAQMILFTWGPRRLEGETLLNVDSIAVVREAV